MCVSSPSLTPLSLHPSLFFSASCFLSQTTSTREESEEKEEDEVERGPGCRLHQTPLRHIVTTSFGGREAGDKENPQAKEEKLPRRLSA